MNKISLLRTTRNLSRFGFVLQNRDPSEGWWQEADGVPMEGDAVRKMSVGWTTGRIWASAEKHHLSSSGVSASSRAAAESELFFWFYVDKLWTKTWRFFYFIFPLLGNKNHFSSFTTQLPFNPGWVSVPEAFYLVNICCSAAEGGNSGGSSGNMELIRELTHFKGFKPAYSFYFTAALLFIFFICSRDLYRH